MQIALERHFDGQLAATEFSNTGARHNAQKKCPICQERTWVDSVCLEMEEIVHLKLWVTLRRPKQVRFCTALFQKKTPRNDVGFFSELPCFFDRDFSCLCFQLKKVSFSCRCNKRGSFVLVRTTVSQ